jgi:spermidine/putrescine transport system substrate-binding protein
MMITFPGCEQDDRVVLNIYNVGDYIDLEVLDIFEEENPNIKINYETFATNEEMYVKVANGSSAYDVIVPSDYMVERLIEEDLLLEIDKNNIPNFKHVGEQYLNQPYDIGNKYSVPYMWGTMGILYNTTMVNEPVTSWDILWDEKYKGQVLMLDSERDAVAITMKMLGFSMNSKDDNELEKAKDALIAQKDIVLAYCGDEVKDKMIDGEGAMTIAWSGDAFFCAEENPDLAYAVPNEGTNLWFDSMVIPKTSLHKEEAEKFIDFMCRPDIALMNTDYIGYSTANETVRSEMLDEETANDSLRYPDLNVENFYEVFVYDKELTRKISDIWLEFKIN